MDADCNGADVLDFLQHVMQDIGIGETLEVRTSSLPMEVASMFF